MEDTVGKIALGQPLIAARTHQRVAAHALEHPPEQEGLAPVAVDHIGPKRPDQPGHAPEQAGKFQRILGVERHGHRAEAHAFGLLEGFGAGEGHDAALVPGGVEQARQFQPVPGGGVEPADIDDLNRAEKGHGRSGEKS